MMWKLLVLLVAVSAVQAELVSLNPANNFPSGYAKPIHAHTVESESRIINGEEAAPGQFPHQVGIYITIPSGGRAFCGGSILNEKVILTAAHCAQPGSKFEVLIGAHKLADKPDQVRNTARKVVHENYQSDGLVANDIALLFLDEPIIFNDKVQPIRLPSAEQASNNFWKSEATLSGWGLQHTHDKTVAPVLRYLKSRVVSNLYCKFRFFFGIVKDTNICISGWWAKGACEGDSGGPLVIYEADGKPTQVGLTSFGIGLGCELSWPSVFTRITPYLDWIAKNSASA